MKAAIIVTAVFALAALLIPGLLMQIFTDDPAVISEGLNISELLPSPIYLWNYAGLSVHYAQCGTCDCGNSSVSGIP